MLHCQAFLNKAVLGIKNQLLRYSDHRVCPLVMICLQRYIEVTKQFRVQSSTGLYTARSAVYWYHETTYICTSLHYCSLNWVKTVLKDAGINTSVFTVHSTKSVSTSAAISDGVSLQEILFQADWSSSRTFNKHYFRPQPFSAFSSAVLKKASNLHVDRNRELSKV